MESLTESQENSRKLWETGKLHWFDFQYEEKRSIQQWFVSSGSALFFSGAYPVVFHFAADFHFSRPHGLRCRENEAKYELQFSWGTRRSFVEAPLSEPVESSTLVLAPRRTYRKDPLDGFKRYTGGWNISSRHYWASVGFTAIPLFAIASVWFLGFGLCLLLLCICYFCCGKKSYGYSRIAYALSLIFLILFSLGAIIGCVILYTGQGSFHRSTTETLEYVMNQADTTVQKLKDVSNFLASAKLTAVDKVFLPSNVQTDIDQIEIRINSSTSILSDRTVENSGDIRDLLDSVRLALIVVAAIMLLLTFLGFLFSIFGIQLLVYILVIVGWILVAGTFILCGTFLLLHNVAGDTCVAMNHWVQNPTAHTALDDILPCVDSATAQDTLLRSKEITLQYVDLINSVITNVSNINFSPNFPSMYFNQSGPLVPILCNPFYHDFTDRPCSPGEVNLNNATQAWQSYVCQVSSTGICITTGRLTPTIYDQMNAAVNLCNGLENYGPFLIDLEDCTFVRETFSEIYRNHCPKLQRYSRWIYVGLVMVSTAVMLSIIFWVIYGRERRHRLYTKQLQAESTQGHEEDKQSQS
ncbi:uncharacterized protein LOC110602897 isoform X1 [Manihot esculenta]|uniref:Uncharacterized protein n=1 Tax=Manihot esculenta TaxID=3983 RepID=A0A2C9UBB6_MANES|nr:uncharacterized protein LOC110602897 isoform X1 [Manihot esculenta]OAY27436.1 hypothetical protein MANES_16G125400v8 [Manihot esculenta]